LGPDRWAALIAARTLHNGASLVVNSRHRDHRRTLLVADGAPSLCGAILPGGRADCGSSCTSTTGRLPIQEGKYSDTPRNTIDAIETAAAMPKASGSSACIACSATSRRAARAWSRCAGRALVDSFPMPRR